MRLAVVTECALSRKHGTGAQLLGILEGSSLEYFHFYFTHAHAGESECARSYRIEDPRWRWRGRRHIGKIERLLGLNWWEGNRLDSARFSSLLRKKALIADAAYVCVGTEEAAGQANAILAELKVPYVVQVMDIYYQAGFDPASMPELAKLVNGASAVVAINEAIKAELMKFGRNDVRILAVGRDTTPLHAAPPQPGQPLRLLLVGNLVAYETGLRVLERIWPEIKQRLGNVTLVYAGAHNHMVPAGLRPSMEDAGYITGVEYDRVVASCHVGVLPGPMDLNHLGKFSIPSRTGDFLAAGLPLLGFLAPGSATRVTLAPLAGEAAVFTNDGVGVAEGLAKIVATPELWSIASAKANAFASDHFNLARTRTAVLEILDRIRHQ